MPRPKYQILERITADLKSGLLRPGEKISELGLASRYEVSRTPIREALLVLSAMGMLVKIPNRGYIVADSGEAAGA